ncbi:hypothetical protein KEM55_006721, partial [Ascosphaera atra]
LAKMEERLHSSHSLRDSSAMHDRRAHSCTVHIYNGVGIRHINHARRASDRLGSVRLWCLRRDHRPDSS